MLNEDKALAARLGSAQRRAASKLLYADNSVRKITLGPGGWRIFGSAVQVYYATRITDASAVVATGETAAPASLPAPTNTGAPPAGSAWDATTGAAGALPLTTDTTQWDEIAVEEGSYRTIYVRAGSATTFVLAGPYE